MGDFGQWSATVRDGNHRAFGSMLGGEERVAIRVYDNDMIELQELLKGRGRPSQQTKSRRMIEKMVRDTGGLAHWMERYKASVPLLQG